MKWEQELGSVFSDSHWLKAIQYNSTFTKCINYWEISQKILHRWYLSPARLVKFTNTNDHLCWSGSQSGYSDPYTVGMPTPEKLPEQNFHTHLRGHRLTKPKYCISPTQHSNG